MNHNSSKSKLREKNIMITALVIGLTCIIMIAAYVRVNTITEESCLERMQEAVDTVAEDIGNKLSRDSVMLNALAEIIAMQDQLDTETMQGIITEFAPLTTAKQISVLLPNDVVISRTGTTMDASGKISFAKESVLGEHVTDRLTGLSDDTQMLIRHFVPIQKDGQVIAMIYSTTRLTDLPDSLNVTNFFNATAYVFLIDRKNGDFLMDTMHETLSNIRDYEHIQTTDGRTMADIDQSVLRGATGHTIMKSEAIHENLYYYYAPLSSSSLQLGASDSLNQWTVSVAVPEKQAYANVFAIRNVCYTLAALESIVLIAYLIWTLHNTTTSMEKAVLEERLIKAENAERAKTMFLSNMSHDIRTPMNAIIGYTTLAAAHIDQKTRVQDYLSKILSSSNHLLSLINDILDMSRIESGRVYIEEIECSLPDILLDLRNILVNQMQAKQLDFYIDTIDVIDEDIWCDKLHLNQVLLNLLSNAIKFTHAGGSVSLTIKQKHGAPEGYAAYEIRVKDTGIGMSAAFMEHLFEPFEREATSTVSGIQGTGLGMAIAKNIVDMMGGTIEVTSEQGKGTEFVLSLEFRLQSERKQIEIIRELEGVRALVVDDDFAICDSVTKMLVQLGLRADWTLSGKEAVLHAKQAAELGDAFQAYIIDLYLPDLNGLEVVRRIRSAVGTDIPIIILSAYDWSSIESEAREAGVTAFCSKPIFLSTLRDTLISTLHTEAQPEESAVLPDAEEELRGKRLLLVEDNELNREIAVEVLTASGFLVETACDGTEAVEIMSKAAAGYYDLILMDVQMPIMNGYVATQEIRKLENPEIANIPIVAMTANAFDEDKRTALHCGMNDHIAKPLDLDQLFGVLRKYLGSNHE